MTTLESLTMAKQVANSELPEWKKRALQDPSLPQRQLDVLMHGPKSLTDAWFLAAMKFKYDRPY